MSTVESARPQRPLAGGYPAGTVPALDSQVRFVRAPVLVGAATGAHTSAPAHPLSIRNVNIAMDTLNYVRQTIYKRGFKSTNKLSNKRSDSSERRRLENAGKELDRVRPYLPNTELWTVAAYTARGHNCGELAFIARKHVVARGGYAEVAGAPGHEFAIIGQFPGVSLPSDMSQWPSHLAVCDPWANIACRATHYPAKFLAKMNKWANDGKRIHDENRWISPNDPLWVLSVLNSVKTIRRPAHSWIDPPKLVRSYPPENPRY